jgi:hypothetical protein
VTPTSRWRDERGLVGKAVVTLLIVVLVIGVAVIEAGSIIFAKLSLENTASSAVADGERQLTASHDAASACRAAAESVKQQDASAQLKDCQANPTTGQIFIRVRKVAATLIVRRVAFLRKLGVVKATAETGPGKV